MEMSEICNKITKNNIPFWRVMFTLAIVVFHYERQIEYLKGLFGIANNWRIGVEFFFLVSGFLLAKKCNESDLTTVDYAKYKFKRLFPEYFVMTIYMCIYYCILNMKNPLDILNYILGLCDELMMLHGTGISYTRINGATWYVSALFICGYFIYYLYKKDRQHFVQFIAPLLILFIYSYLSKEYGRLSGTLNMTPIHFTKALLRGFAGLSLGVVLYEVYLKLSLVKLTSKGIRLLHIVEYLCFLIVLIANAFVGTSRRDFLFVLLLFIGVLFAFLHQNPSKFFSNVVINKLDKWSYSIFLNHCFVRNIFQDYIVVRWNNGIIFFIYFICAIIWSISMYYVTQFLFKHIHLKERYIQC